MRQPYSHKSTKLMERICRRIAQGATLKRVCEGSAFPGVNTVFAWRRTDPEFKAMYEAACEQRATRAKLRKAQGPPKPQVHDTYSLGVAEEICDRIVAGAGISDLADAPDLPCLKTINNWRARHAEFQALYAAACELRGEILADETLRIADDESKDYRRGGKDGAEMVPSIVNIHRARVRIDTRKWRFGTLARKAGAWRKKDSDEPRPITLEEALLQLERPGDRDLPPTEE